MNKTDKKQMEEWEEYKPADITHLAAHSRVALDVHLQHRKRMFIFGAIAGLLLGLGFVLAYLTLQKQGSLSKTYVMGIPVDKTVSDAQLSQRLTDNWNAYRFTLLYPEPKVAKFSPSDAGISLDVKATVNKVRVIRQQNSVWQKLQWWNGYSTDGVVNVDTFAMEAFIENKATVIKKAPVNATLTMSGDQPVITPDTAGTGHILVNANEKLLAASRELQPMDFGLLKQSIPAKVTKPQLHELAGRIKAALDQEITLTIEDRSFRPDRATIASWIEPITSTSKKANLEYNTGKIQEYIDKIAKPYVQLPRSEIVIPAADGLDQVLVSGRNGTDINNKRQVSVTIAKALTVAQPVDMTLTVSEAPFEIVKAQEYDKWIVVDTTNKRMDAYEKDVLVRSFKVSAGAPATPTVLGQFKIYAKVRKQDMRGLNTDGSSYFQADVEWTNYFYGDYAIHGNYWRPSSWFGAVNSSHGCVGIMNVDAEWLYNWAPVGTPVITHL